MRALLESVNVEDRTQARRDSVACNDVKGLLRNPLISKSVVILARDTTRPQCQLAGLVDGPVIAAR